MSKYINPPEEKFGLPAKESWLIRQLTIANTAKEIKFDDFKSVDFDEALSRNKLYLVLIDNGAFTALLVCDTKDELEYAKRMMLVDKRPLFFIECNKDVALEYAS